MNSITGPRSTLGASHAEVAASGLRAHIGPLLRQPWLLCAMVLMVALMSSYVHVLSGQVERGERLRSQGYAQAAKSAGGADRHLMTNTTQRPLATVGMDTGR